MNEKQKRMRSENLLVTAVVNEHYDTAKFLIEQGADVTCCNNLPIIEAVKTNFCEMVKLLIHSGADATARNNEPLKIAIKNAKYGNPEIMDYLILNGADSSLVDDSMYSILKDAVECCNVKMAEYIISNGADVTYNDNEAICIAADADVGSRSEMIEILVSAGADVNARHGFPLIAASNFYHDRDITFLIEHGAAKDACEYCAFMVARECHTDDAFIEADVNPLIETDFRTCIEYAAEHKYKDIVEWLLCWERKADDFLVYATENGYSETAKFLLDSGYECDKIKALILACTWDFEDIAEAIIDSGCDFSDQRLFALIITAVKNCSEKLVKRLIEAGALISEGAVWQAAYERKFEILKALLSKEDKQYIKSALQGAFECGRTDIVKFLIDNYSIRLSSYGMNDLLESAIEGESVEMVKLAIKNGAKANELSQNVTKSSIYHVINAGKYELFEFLVKSGMKTDKGMLYCAVKENRSEFAEVLLKNGVRPSQTIIQLAVKLGRTKILKAFVDAGISVI